MRSILTGSPANEMKSTIDSTKTIIDSLPVIFTALFTYVRPTIDAKIVIATSNTPY